MAAVEEGHNPGAGAPADAGAEIAGIARTGEPDRYLAALLAPAPEREGLLALAAFAAETARVPHRVVHEPIMGELRLEWWRTALAAPEGESAGHSVADAMRAAVRRHRLPTAILDDLLDARMLELAAAPFPDDAAIDDFLWRTEGALFGLAGRVLSLEANREAEDACRAAGRAYGLARLILGLPRSLSRGRMPLAQTQVIAAGLSAHELLAGAGGTRVEALMRAHVGLIRSDLAQVRRIVRRLPRQARAAFLPLALVPSYVRRLERLGGGALREEAQILPLTRVWRIAAAHVLGL